MPGKNFRVSRKHSEKDILQRFGEALREARLKKGLSQEKAADIMGSDRVTWSLMETGKRNVSLVTVFRAARAIDTPLHSIIKDACDDTPPREKGK